MKLLRMVLATLVLLLVLPRAALADPVVFTWTATQTAPVPASFRLDQTRNVLLGAVAPERVIAAPGDVLDSAGKPILPAGALLMPSSDPRLFCEPKRRDSAPAFACLKDTNGDDSFDQACEITVDMTEQVVVTYLLAEAEPVCGKHLPKPIALKAFSAGQPPQAFVALKLMSKPTADEDANAALCLTAARPVAATLSCDDYVHYIPIGHLGFEVFLYVAGAKYEFHAEPAKGVTVKATPLRVGQPFPDPGSRF